MVADQLIFFVSAYAILGRSMKLELNVTVTYYVVWEFSVIEDSFMLTCHKTI